MESKIFDLLAHKRARDGSFAATFAGAVLD